MKRGHERAARFLVRRYQLPPSLRAPSRSSARQTRTPSHTLCRQRLPPSARDGSGRLVSFRPVLLPSRTTLLALIVTTQKAERLFGLRPGVNTPFYHSQEIESRTASSIESMS